MLRVLDANFNRVGEGLRILEDIARFTLNDPELSGRLKSLRHELLPYDQALQRQLLSARDTESDVGTSTDKGERDNVVSIVTANARRVQESLRVLEEVSKLPNAPAMDWTRFKRARFALYELEHRLTLKLLHQDKAGKIAGLYVIIDAEALKGRSEAEVTQRAIEGGAKVIQLRDKQRGKGELLPIAQRLKGICTASGVPFLIDDHLDLALASDADGLHLGQKDLPIPVARRLLPQDKLLGCSTATAEEAIKAEKEGADYIAVGAIYETSTKLEDYRLAGLETLRQVKKAVSVPVVAIGGINERNLPQVLAAGADAIAVIGAVLGAEDVAGAAQRLVAGIESFSRE